MVGYWICKGNMEAENVVPWAWLNYTMTKLGPVDTPVSCSAWFKHHKIITAKRSPEAKSNLSSVPPCKPAKTHTHTLLSHFVELIFYPRICCWSGCCHARLAAISNNFIVGKCKGIYQVTVPTQHQRICWLFFCNGWIFNCVTSKARPSSWSLWSLWSLCAFEWHMVFRFLNNSFTLFHSLPSLFVPDIE